MRSAEILAASACLPSATRASIGIARVSRCRVTLLASAVDSRPLSFIAASALTLRAKKPEEESCPAKHVISLVSSQIWAVLDTSA